MNTYESPSIIELGSVENLTNASGDDHWFDSNLPGIRGQLQAVINGTGGSYGS